MTDHIVELMWQTLEQLKTCLNNTYSLEKKIKKISSADIPESPLSDEV